MTLEPQKQEKWEEELDNKYGSFAFAPVVNAEGHRALRNFVHSLLSQTRKEALEEVVRMCEEGIQNLPQKAQVAGSGYLDDEGNDHYLNGMRKALSDLAAEIRKKI